VAPCTRKYAGGLDANESGVNYVYAYVYSIKLFILGPVPISLIQVANPV